MLIRPRWKKVFSDLWDNKVRSLLVVFSIAVGVFSVGMISGAYVVIAHDMDASYASVDPANIRLWAGDFTDEIVKSISHISGVLEVEGRRTINVRIKAGPEKWISLDLLAIEDFQVTRINRLITLSGNPVPADRQLLLEQKVLKQLDIHPGDRVEVQMPDSTVKSMQVAGIVLDQTTSAGDFLAPPLGYVNLDTVEWLGQPSTYNQLLVRVADLPNDLVHIRTVANNVSDKLEKAGNIVYRTRLSKTNEHPMAATVQAILGILGALGVLIVFLSSSLIANTLNALLSQHLQYIGVMKLIGARRLSIFGMYTVLILSFGLIALLIAVPAGGQGAYFLSNLIADQMNFQLQGYRIVPLAIILQVAISLIVPLAAGFLPVNNGSRIKVQRAINSSTVVNVPTRSRLADRLGHKMHWLPRPVSLSLRNTFRRKGRLVLTLFTLSMGVAIFIAVFNVQATLEQYVGNIGKYFLADVSLSFDRPYRNREVIETAHQVAGVKWVEGWAFLSAEALYSNDSVAETIQILAPPANSALVDPLLVDGRWLLPSDQKSLAVSEALLSTFPNLKPGDTLRLKIAGHKETWLVVGIFKFVGRDSVIAYTTYEYLSQRMNIANQAYSFRILGEEHGMNAQRQMSLALDQHFRSLGYRVNDVKPGLDTLQTASEGLGILITFLLIMALLTAVVGSIGLTGTMGINVLERKREIGVMRAIGATDIRVFLSVITEGLLIGLLSWFIAALASFPISILLARIISQAIFNSPIDLAFTLNGFGIWMAVVVFLATVASLLPARNATRLTIREVLAYE